MICAWNHYFSRRMLFSVLGLISLVACSNRAPEPQRKSAQSATSGPSSQSDQRVDASQQSMASGGEPENSVRASESSAPAAPKQSASHPKEGSSPPAGKPPTPTAGPISEMQTVNTAEKDVVLLKASLGTVRFEHKKHSKDRKIACETCHHASRPEHAATAPQEACGTCHTSTATPPMKTKLQAVFHNPTATAGTCIDCHKAENAKGKTAPVKCLGCHKKEAA